MFKTGLSFAAGGVFGGAMGLFTASVNPNFAMDPAKQSVRDIFREMKTTTMGYAKNFAMIGAMFAAVECSIESFRGVSLLFIKKDFIILVFLG